VRALHVGLRSPTWSGPWRSTQPSGYEVLGDAPETEFGSLTMLKLPGDEFMTLELIHSPAQGHLVPVGFNHLVVQVEAVHALVSHLGTQGYRAAAPTSPDSSHEFWTAWVTDPDGYRLELVQWPREHPDGMTRSDFAKPDDEGG
jgi:lactoylglutathione lyase